MASPLALSTVWQRLSDRETARIRDSFVGEADLGRGTSSWLAVLLAVLVLAAYAVLTLLGLWMAAQTLGLMPPVLSRMVTGFFAVLFLLMAWQARPRFPESYGWVVTEQEAPEFFRLVTEIARQLKMPMPERITLTPEPNAFAGRSGFPPKLALGLGLPLWYALPPQERVSVIAHELAHHRNGDPARTGVVSLALNFLATILDLILPDGLAGAHMGKNGVALNLAHNPLAALPYLTFRTLLNLVGVQHQRAEFRADLLSAQVAGTAAVTETLDKMHLLDDFEPAVRKHRYFPSFDHAYLELRHTWDSMPDEKRQVRREEYAAQKTRLDSSHPPTADRIAVVNAHPYAAQLTLDDDWAAQIDEELLPFVRMAEQQGFC